MVDGLDERKLKNGLVLNATASDCPETSKKWTEQYNTSRSINNEINIKCDGITCSSSLTRNLLKCYVNHIPRNVTLFQYKRTGDISGSPVHQFLVARPLFPLTNSRPS